jgi:transposase-like protein
MAREPKTLQQAILYFADPKNCREYLVARRWPNGVECPQCGSKSVKFSEKYNRWQCASHHERRQFTLKTGTIFEDSPIGLDKWLTAMWMVVNCKNGVSSYEIARDLGVTQKSAWFMLHRLREVMEGTSDPKLSGEVEADETFIGGNVKNMHRRSKRCVSAKNDGNWGKTIVLGLLERDGNVRAAVAPNRHKHNVHSNIQKHVEAGSTLYTDEFTSYDKIPDYAREVINHLQGYVRGQVHTNGIENFWSLLKRTLKGTYVSVDPAHLQAYVNEQVFRFNNRKDMNDADRFSVAVSQIVGRRLTWDDLIGKEGETEQAG